MFSSASRVKGASPGAGRDRERGPSGSAPPSRRSLAQKWSHRPKPSPDRSPPRLEPARPPTCATAARISSGLMLSSSRRAGPAASASSISAGSRTSTVTAGPAARRAPAHGRAHAAGHRAVVLLDQDRVVEPRAVVDPAAVRHRRLLERPQARRRLAGVEQPRSRPPPHRPHHPRRQRRDAREAPEEVQGGPLGHEQPARRSLHPQHAGARPAPLALGASRSIATPGSTANTARRRQGRRSRRAPSA